MIANISLIILILGVSVVLAFVTISIVISLSILVFDRLIPTCKKLCKFLTRPKDEIIRTTRANIVYIWNKYDDTIILFVVIGIITIIWAVIIFKTLKYMF